MLGFFIVKIEKEVSDAVLSFEGRLHGVPGGGKGISVYSVMSTRRLFPTGLGAVAFICSLIQKLFIKHLLCAPDTVWCL